MAPIGWIGLGTLCTKVLAASNSFPEMLDYTAMAISVCASCAAVIAILNKVSEPIEEQPSCDEAVTLRSMADQTLFAESRLRLLDLAERMERRRTAKTQRPDSRRP